MTEKEIINCIALVTEMCDKRLLSKTLDIAVGILRHFEDCWQELPDNAKRSFVERYGKGAMKNYEE